MKIQLILKMDNIVFKNPEFFWLFLILPVLLFFMYRFRFKKTNDLKVSYLRNFKSNSLKTSLYPILSILRILSIGLIITALARPQTISNTIKSNTKLGIDIVIAVDVSGSMLSKDLKPDRLEALKTVASEFIKDRINDRIGLVIYAGESYTKTPVTSDKEVVINSLNELSYDDALKTGTAIGMGLSTAVNRLKESTSKSKVIILLTDGDNNSGFIDPLTAAEIASTYGIKTYTIGLGTIGNALTPVRINYDGKLIYERLPVKIDEKLLKEIANKTEGKYFRATDNNKLKEIYDEINKLEKTEYEESKFTDIDEKFRPLILLSISLIFIELLLRYTIFKSFI